MTTRGRSSPVLLRALALDDRALIRNWLADASIRAWWGSPAAIEAEIAIAIESKSAICRMIEADGAAIGYGNAYDAGLMEPDGDPIEEPGVWQCTFFIGSEAHRGAGLEITALALLADEVLSTTLAIACETRVPVRNEAAVRQIERIGFRWKRVEDQGALGPFWIMRRDRFG
jgi:aminoglycoside 6'-N-acetyltransferase